MSTTAGWNSGCEVWDRDRRSVLPVAKAALAPAVKDLIHEVIGHGLFIGDLAVALLAFQTGGTFDL